MARGEDHLTFRAGQLVVTADPGVGDEYLARVLRPILAGTKARNPVVEILRILRYPAQRAVAWPDVATENPPLTFGALVRMPVARSPGPEDLRFGSWEESLAAALADAMGAAAGPEETEILKRHAAGAFRGRRAILHYSRWTLWQP